MKIKKDIMTGFLRKIRMSGSLRIDEGIFRFEEDGLKVDANSKSNQARMMGWLKKAAFKEYDESFGNIGVNDLENVSKVLERFGEEITLTKEGNLLTIKGNSKKVDIELVSVNFLETDADTPDLTFDETFNMTSAKLKDVFKDVQMNKDSEITMSTEEKKVKISNTGKYKFLNEITAPTCKGGVKVKFGEQLIEAAQNLDGELQLSVKTDYPIKILEKLETSVVTLIVAPRVNNAEEE